MMLLHYLNRSSEESPQGEAGFSPSLSSLSAHFSNCNQPRKWDVKTYNFLPYSTKLLFHPLKEERLHPESVNLDKASSPCVNVGVFHFFQSNWIINIMFLMSLISTLFYIMYNSRSGDVFCFSLISYFPLQAPRSWSSGQVKKDILSFYPYTTNLTPYQWTNKHLVAIIDLTSVRGRAGGSPLFILAWCLAW